MILRAITLTTSVMTNSTRPVAIKAPRPVGSASPNLVAMLAAMVLPPVARRTWIETPKDAESTSDRLAECPPEAEQDRADHARAGVRQHRGPDHLQLGRPEGQRRLPVRLR